MTVDVRPRNAGETLAELAARLYKVEQKASSPSAAGGGAGIGSDPSVNTITIDGVVVGADASPPTALTLTTGAHMEDIWIDADWDAPIDGTAASYDVELARKVSGVYQLVQNFRIGTATGVRMAGLEPQQTYGVRVKSINRIGVHSTYTPSSGFSDITTGLDSTVPAQASNFQMVAGIRTIMATWNEVADRDVARGTGTYEIQLATDVGFTALFASKFTSATITSFSGVASSTTYWGRVRAVDNSGNAGAWSTSASVTTVPAGTGDIGTGAVQTTNIAALAVGNAQIANLAVDDAKVANLSADKLTTGTLDANRIAANTIDVDKLTSSTLTSKTITIGTGGTLKIGNPPTTGIFINDQGIRLYSGSAVKVALDVSGTASFEGNISASTITSSTLTSATINSGTITGTTVRTASSGKRIALESGVIDWIKLYTGHGSESAPGQMGVAVSGSTLFSQIDAPRSSNDYGSMSSWSVTGGNGSGSGFSLRNSSNVVRASLILGSSSNSDIAGLEVIEVDGLYCHFAANADVALRGSGDYAFVYFWGGGLEATINANIGLGSGVHIMNGTNATFTPVQASAFNVASSRSTKRNITDSDPVLERLMAIRVKRYQRIPDRLVTSRNPGSIKADGTFGVRAEPEPVQALPDHILRSQEIFELGLIAEELLEIEPGAVAIGEHGPTGISLGYLVAMLVKAVQEINGRIPGRA